MNVVAAISTGVGYAMALVTVPFALAIIALRRIAGFSRRFDAILRFGAALLPAAFGVVVRSRGIHRIPTRRPVVFVANHVNILDGFVIQSRIPVSVRGLELDEHFRWPIYGLAMRLYGNIPIPHRSPRTAAARLQTAVQALRRGDSVLVFPEGSRTRNGRTARFKSGPFRLVAAAAASDVPVAIVPLALYGAYHRKRVGSPRVTPGTIELRIGTPLHLEAGTETSYRALRETLQRRIETLLEE